MSEGKTIHEIHLEYVDQLMKRGKNVVQPRGKPMGITYGYDKTIGLISAGTIFEEKDGTFSLLHDMCQHGYTGVRWENLGLCDARCWYEAIEDKRIKDVNKEQAEKLFADRAKGREQFEKDDEAEPVRHSALAELCINISEGQAVVRPNGDIEFHDTGLNISLRDLQFVVQEAEAYLKYRKERGDAQTKAN